LANDVLNQKFDGNVIPDNKIDLLNCLRTYIQQRLTKKTFVVETKATGQKNGHHI